MPARRPFAGPVLVGCNLADHVLTPMPARSVQHGRRGPVSYGRRGLTCELPEEWLTLTFGESSRSRLCAACENPDDWPVEGR
jgi:hypothetical protein